jgi:hypothetical protein
MQRITVTAPPRALVDAVHHSASFSEVSSDASLRRTLWEQQRGRCAYCERVLRDPSRDDHRTRIEHFHPQSSAEWTIDCSRESGASVAERAAIAWTNLLLCCDGNEAAGRDFTCDKLKGNRDICADFCNPHRWPGGAVLAVKRDGRVTPSPGLPAAADRVVQDVLNLNAPALVHARRSVLDARRAAISRIRAKHGGLTPRVRRDIAEILRRDAETHEFGAALLSLADEMTR